ncbi:hypothetical protein [Amycolatopsis sp. Hca4]|uniref:hypothetical protein n=1 Tax=unclassified Amycolatopsis TaxID=2618356 RepID=UPI001591BA8F|nr:hypothetical protein [Amycolatopsis sp. Hca4]QKV75320.1 hypothetical protein HUT10_17235 [Amycolatopsis sp. Hca4]
MSFRHLVLVVAATLGLAACSTPADPAPAPAPSGPQVTVGSLHLPLPVGATYTEHSPDGLLDGCVSEGTAVCEARLLDLRTTPADAPINLPSTKRPFGWYTGTDLPTCITPASPPGKATGATGSTLLDAGFAPIGPKKAEYGRWKVTCENSAQNNVVRMWWLPTSRILVVQYGSFPGWDAKMDNLLAGATFS